MRIKCPYCGERALDEFAYLGDASVVRPDYASPTAMAEFVSYVYERTNSAHRHRELWYHAAGCHACLVVTRVIATHQIGSVELAKKLARQRTAAKRGEA